MVFVFRAKDCSGNLRLLSAMQRPAVRSRIEIRGVLYGSTDELLLARRALAGSGVKTPIRTLTDRQVRALGSLGHRALPFWLLFDPHGQLVLSLSTPTTPDEYLRAIDLITRVTDAPSDS